MAPILLLVVSSVVFLRNIDNFPLRNWDEAWYAEIIKNMASGNSSLLVPFWNGQYYFDKPPLYFWLSLPFFKFFGPGEWQTRIISVIAAILATLLVYLIGKKLFNREAGVFASLVFLTLGQVVIRFNHGNLDALLVCFQLATFYFYLLSQKKKTFSFLTGIALGFGFLIKGWFLGLYPLLVIILYSLFTQKKLPRALPLILEVAFLSSAWYYALGFLKLGQPFYQWYLLNPGGGLLNSPFSSFSLHYFQDLLKDSGLWLILLVPFVFEFKKVTKRQKLILASLAVSIITLIFPLNFLSEKLGWYNLPAYPLVATIFGYILWRQFKFIPKITFFLVGTILIFQIYNVIRIENTYPDRSTIGATLGKHSKNLVRPSDTVILDDHDFTSFLFYSDQKKVYTIEEKQKSELMEWWKIKRDNLETFIEAHPNTWIITKNPRSLNIKNQNGQIQDVYETYSFIKF